MILLRLFYWIFGGVILLGNVLSTFHLLLQFLLIVNNNHNHGLLLGWVGVQSLLLGKMGLFRDASLSNTLMRKKLLYILGNEILLCSLCMFIEIICRFLKLSDLNQVSRMHTSRSWIFSPPNVIYHALPLFILFVRWDLACTFRINGD